MAFTNDRSLLVLEPSLFQDLKFAGQTYVDVPDAMLVGTTLSSLQADFVNAQIQPGFVTIVQNIPLEVVAVLSANSLT